MTARRIAILAALISSIGTPQTALSDSSRLQHPFGIFGSVLNPYPGLANLGVSYNALPWLRGSASVGIGVVDTCYGIGVEAFAMPERTFSPLLGITFTGVKDTGLLCGGYFGPCNTAHYVTLAGLIGADYQADFGLNLRAGLTFNLHSSGDGARDFSSVLPFAAVGWFF